MAKTGLTQRELAALADVGVKTIRNAVDNKRLSYTIVDKLVALAAMVESHFIPGSEPTHTQWFAVEDSIMPLSTGHKVIRNYRRLRRMMVPEAADAACVSTHVWRRWEESSGPVWDEAHAYIADALGISVDQITASLHAANNPQRFGAWIKETRDTLCMPDTVFAVRMRVTVATVGRWETGKSRFPQSRIARLARAFDLPVDNVIKRYRD